MRCIFFLTRENAGAKAEVNLHYKLFRQQSIGFQVEQYLRPYCGTSVLAILASESVGDKSDIKLNETANCHIVCTKMGQ